MVTVGGSFFGPMYNLDRHLLKNPRCLASTPKFPALLEVVFFLSHHFLMGKVGRCSSESQPLFIVVGLENSQIGSFPQVGVKTKII